MSQYLVDTNVLFQIFRKDYALRAFIESLECYIDATIYIECIQGSKSNRDKAIIEKYLQRFQLLPLTQQTSAKAIELIRTYSNTNGLLLPDALIAANAIENGLKLITYNLNDFKFIAGLDVIKPNI